VRAPAYSSREIHEHENDQALDSLHDRVSVLKRVCMLHFHIFADHFNILLPSIDLAET
jgi:hypothetical protein